MKGGKSRQSVVLILMVFGVFLPYMTLRVEAVQCYVCFWHEPSSSTFHHTTNDTNETSNNGNNSTKNSSAIMAFHDTCSGDNFNPDYVRVVHDCVHGCEVVRYRNSKTGDVQLFYRNCAQEGARNHCYNKEEKTRQYVSTCECLSDFCNASGRLRPEFFTFFFYGLVLITVFWFEPSASSSPSCFLNLVQSRR